MTAHRQRKHIGICVSLILYYDGVVSFLGSLSSSLHTFENINNIGPTRGAPVEGTLLGVAGAAVQRAVERPILVNWCNMAVWGHG